MVEAGKIISGKYKLLRLLGDGGMGAVYEAEHLNLGTRVAIKVLHPDLARRPGIAERFLQEARVSAQIRSPHVVQVTDVDRTPDGVAYLVMELLEGEPLAGVLRRERRLTVATACEYTAQILQALEAAHALGVIHRDLKPENVFVTFQGGRPALKLIDFGIAKLKTAQVGQTKNLTVAGMLMGTPEYMAPEQAHSADKVDVRADLYAVGVMLYEMLSGQAPATADDPRVLILKVERGEVVPLVKAAPGIEPQLAGFVHRAMAPRPELRFANATEMRLALEAILSGKRLATAQLREAAGLAATQEPPRVPPVVASAPALADVEAGSGTVMGAPAMGALTPPQPVGSGAPMHGGTVGAAPLVMSPIPPHGYVQSALTPYEPTRPPPRRGGSGLVVALAVIALLLGAGAVVAYVMSTESTSPVVPPPDFAAAPPTTPSPADTAAPPAQPPVAVAPLTTSPTSPVVATKPSASAAKPGQTSSPNPNTSRPQAPQDAGAATPPVLPPIAIPTPTVVDAGDGQATVVTPFGSFQFPGPRPPFYPADQPWPPPAPTFGTP